MGTAGGIGEIGIAAVDNDVAFIQKRYQLIDEFVYHAAGTHHQHHDTRAFQLTDQLFQAVRAHDLSIFGRARQKIVYFGNGTVVGHYFEAFVVHVENQVLAHYGQTDYADVTFHLLSLIY